MFFSNSPIFLQHKKRPLSILGFCGNIAAGLRQLPREFPTSVCQRNGTGTSHILSFILALFIERGFGPRGVLTCSQHARTSVNGSSVRMRRQIFCWTSLPGNMELRGLLVCCSGQTLSSRWVSPRGAGGRGGVEFGSLIEKPLLTSDT